LCLNQVKFYKKSEKCCLGSDRWINEKLVTHGWVKSGQGDELKDHPDEGEGHATHCRSGQGSEDVNFNILSQLLIKT